MLGALLKIKNKELKGFKKANKKMSKSVFKMDNNIRDLELERVTSSNLQKGFQSRVNVKNADIEVVKKKLYAIKEARD